MTRITSTRPAALGIAGLLLCLLATGCLHHGRREAGHDPPLSLGAVTDAFWQTHQASAEAADFVFYDHEFTGDTARLAPGAKRHLEQVALRLEHVPFPVVIEQSPHNARPDLDQARRRTIIQQLARLGRESAEGRVVVASAFAEGFTAIEGERAYHSTLNSDFSRGGGIGRRFGGQGGFFR